jgi:hypothetical protein
VVEVASSDAALSYATFLGKENTMKITTALPWMRAVRRISRARSSFPTFPPLPARMTQVTMAGIRCFCGEDDGWAVSLPAHQPQLGWEQRMLPPYNPGAGSSWGTSPEATFGALLGALGSTRQSAPSNRNVLTILPPEVPLLRHAARARAPSAPAQRARPPGQRAVCCSPCPRHRCALR